MFRIVDGSRVLCRINGRLTFVSRSMFSAPLEATYATERAAKDALQKLRKRIQERNPNVRGFAPSARIEAGGN